MTVERYLAVMTTSETWLRVSALLQIARHAGKRIVRVSTDQTHCADDEHENNG
jgi:hypothetical protein